MRDGKTVSQGFGGADTVLRDGKSVSQVLWRCLCLIAGNAGAVVLSDCAFFHPLPKGREPARRSAGSARSERGEE